MAARAAKTDQFRVPLMFAFRDAFAEGDAAKRLDERVEGERIVARRGSLRRRGIDEARLRLNFAVDLVALVETIDLASAIDLSGLDHVARSVLNFGLPDLASLSTLDSNVAAVAEGLKQALLRHEPRLRPESLRVERAEADDETDQRLRLNVSAELVSAPVDLSLEFIADIEIGSGKIILARLPVSS